MPMAAIVTVEATIATKSEAQNFKQINVQHWGPVHPWTFTTLRFGIFCCDAFLRFLGRGRMGSSSEKVPLAGSPGLRGGVEACDQKFLRCGGLRRGR